MLSTSTQPSCWQRPRCPPSCPRLAFKSQIKARSKLSKRSVDRVIAHNNWRVFGPSADYNDGDKEFFQLTNKLQDQYEWFAPQREELVEEPVEDKPEFGLTPQQIRALGLSGSRTLASSVDPVTLSSKNYLRGERFAPDQLGYNMVNISRETYKSPGGVYQAPRSVAQPGAQASRYPEGRPVFFPEAERYGNPPDLPSLLLQQRVIYISMPFLPSVTELVVAQCYYLDFDEKSRNKPIYVYLNSTGCLNDQGQAVSADNEFYAMWASLGFTRAPLYTGVTGKAQNQAAVLLAAGQRGHRYTFRHSQISTAPPVVNRVFGVAVDAQLQSTQLQYATKYYAAILSRSTGKDLATCEKQYLERKRYFTVKEAYEEGLVDKMVPGYSMNRFRKMRSELMERDEQTYVGKSKPKFKFTRRAEGPQP